MPGPELVAVRGAAGKSGRDSPMFDFREGARWDDGTDRRNPVMLVWVMDVIPHRFFRRSEQAIFPESCLGFHLSDM